MTVDLAAHPDHVVAPPGDRWMPHLTSAGECNCWCARCARVENGEVVECLCPDCDPADGYH